MSVSCVTGSIIAVSHVFGPRKFFIELSCGSKTSFIVGQEKQEFWQAVLRVNSTFFFSHLVKKNCDFKGRRLNHRLSLWATTADSTCTEVVGLPAAPGDGGCSWHKVTGVYQPLALYKLENVPCLSLTFVRLCANVPDLREGQEIIVLHGHFVWDCLFMCGRSRLILRDGSDCLLPSEKNLLLISLVAKLDFSIQDVFWLKTQLDVFEEKFSDQFLQGVGVILELCPGLRERVLAMSVKLVSTHTTLSRSVVEEFLAHSQCDLDRPAVFSKNFPTLRDIAGACPVVDSSSFWGYSCEELSLLLPEMPVVAYLDTTGGHWTLKDSTLSVPCILTSLDHPSTVLPLVGNFVALTRFHLVWEYFKTETGTLSYVYLVVSASDLRLVFDMQRKLAEHLGACTRCGRASNASHVCLSHGPPAECALRAARAPARREGEAPCSSGSAGSGSIGVRCLHKSAVRIPTGETAPRGHVLGLLQEGETTQLHYLELGGRLLMLLPLLNTDTAYKLWWPQDSPELVRREAPCFLGKTVNTRSLIVLPQDSSFCCTQISQKCKDFYSVSEGLQEGLSSEVMDLEGVIADRSHVDPKYISEKLPLWETGYGVPMCKTTVLRLEEVGGGPKTNVYLPRWDRSRYPLGLLPGCCVRLTMMEKRLTAEGAYFSSSPLTTVEVLAVGQPWDVAPDEDWGGSCLLLHVPPGRQLVWGTVVLSRLLKVSLKAVCKTCGCLLRGDACGFVGCHDKTAALPSALLTAKVADACAEAILVVKDDLVRQVLEMSEVQWQALLKLAIRDGELLYLFREKAQMHEPQTLGQEVFKLYCSVIAQCRNIILHVRCKKYPPDSNSEFNYNIPILYCVDIRRYRPTTTKSTQLGS
ncbi:uncharacterized protein LOC134532724 isoform X2 [Bacillus rossius redtenbacheri]|uniref:uncharacterized protein LOC134532724 isoform X2 n=1 Tax=Bacillus rossius redtenbacheri TaxID=93214 RepID=UPI002FDE4900